MPELEAEERSPLQVVISKKVAKRFGYEGTTIQTFGKGFRGNPNILAEGAQFEWIPEMVEELRLCVKSILHFAQNHFYVHSLDEGVSLLKLYPGQINALKTFKHHHCVLLECSRQIGKTTLLTIYALHETCFKKGRKIAIVANKRETATEIFDRIKLAYEKLPLYLKPSVKKWSANGFELSNNSLIDVFACSSAGPRGGSYNVVLLDEVAFWPPEIVEQLWNSTIPVISNSKEGKVLVASTHNGTNCKFYELVEDAKNNPNTIWKRIRIDWWEFPGRDEEWKKKMIALLGSEEAFNEEYGNIPRSKEDDGSMVRLITKEEKKELLESAEKQVPVPVEILYEGSYRIFRRPVLEGFYTIGCDVAEGVGQNFSVAQILRIDDLSNIEQVAIFRSNTISPHDFGTRLLEIAADWGLPPIVVEANSMGHTTLDVLQNAYYNNIVSYSRSLGKIQQESNFRNRIGIFSSENTKTRAIVNLRYWLKIRKTLRLYDTETIEELFSFARNEGYVWRKISNKDKDDCVLALCWALFCLDPELVNRYFNVVEITESGHPLILKPLFNTNSYISQSRLINKNSSLSFNLFNRNSNVQQYKSIYTMADITPVEGFGDLSGYEKEGRELLDWLTKF